MIELTPSGKAKTPLREWLCFNHALVMLLQIFQVVWYWCIKHWNCLLVLVANLDYCHMYTNRSV